VDNLYGRALLQRYIRQNIENYKDAVIVSPDAGGAKRATAIADSLGLNFALIHKVIDTNGCMLSGRNSTSSSPSIPTLEETDAGDPAGGQGGEQHGQLERAGAGAAGRQQEGRVVNGGGGSNGGSGGVVSGTDNYYLEAHEAHQAHDPQERRPTKIAEEPKATMMLVGDVAGKVCILVDDLADTAHTIVRAAKLLKKEGGATRVYALLTHGVFSGGALARINAASALDRVVVTNSVPQDGHRRACPKLEVLDISPFFAEGIRRLHHGESISVLFQHD
jgi:phosphoribosylpyrophosphate synthetase